MFIFISLFLAKYFPSKWDPLAKRTRAYKDIKAIDGWLSSHKNKLKVDSFGDLSIVTYNLYSGGHSDSTSAQVMAITEILDVIHPSLMFLQGIDSELLDRLKVISRHSKHYFLINTVKHSRDLYDGQDYYLPMFYDARIFQVKDNGYFETGGDLKVVYGSWARFKSLKTEFTAVNIDLFSSFKEITDAMFVNIVSDIKSDKITRSFPVVFGGTIMTETRDIKELIDNEYKDLLKNDENNAGLSKTTYHVKGAFKDEITRDKIFIRDQFNQYYLNYARILSDFPLIGDHYPVHAILSIVERPVMKRVGNLNLQNNALGALKALNRSAENSYVNKAIREAYAAAPAA
ncbi:Endonuclease exonuclease phosphatase [Tubulinosema ratisbonensis]|uniref:Endonuclease exonuclease phosphatase n=1 Tax=Tubulinosema ratisbonensis TaxID=291195 RepID=A0A437AKD4_9MICR|nr:Endonuclease exonuclease phosphatase [Tubulinosema ratisbonensis]